MTSEFEADILFDLARQVQAYRMLHDPQVGGQFGPNEILGLCREAGYGEEAAQKAASERGKQRLDQGLPMFQTRYVHQ